MVLVLTLTFALLLSGSTAFCATHCVRAGATGGGSGAQEALCTGVAWGAAAGSLPGSRMPTPADVAGIKVSLTTKPDLTLVLKH